jgi:hypothetical protein
MNSSFDLETRASAGILSLPPTLSLGMASFMVKFCYNYYASTVANASFLIFLTIFCCYEDEPRFNYTLWNSTDAIYYDY